MKNSPVLNISANAVVKNLGNVSKPVLQANPGESTGSFDHTFAQHMEKVAQTHRQEKPATFDAPKPHPQRMHTTQSRRKNLPQNQQLSGHQLPTIKPEQISKQRLIPPDQRKLIPPKRPFRQA